MENVAKVGNSQLDDNKIEEILALNKDAWDKSSQEYIDYCKTYYINIMLTNRLQQMIEQRKELT